MLVELTFSQIWICVVIYSYHNVSKDDLQINYMNKENSLNLKTFYPHISI